MNCIRLIFLSLSAATLLSCSSSSRLTDSGLRRADFAATTADGEKTALYVLRNSNGMEACITNYGARVVSLTAPDRNGHFDDVVCGYPSINDYLTNKQNFGAAVGRYIGRILGAKFTLDGVEYHLTANTGQHCSHGGDPGFAYKVWSARKLNKHTLELRLTSPDGDNGFPGKLDITLLYTLTDNNELRIEYTAVTDKPTVVNLSHHSFFNVSGDFNRSVESQTLYVDADSYTPFDSLKCVTGEILPVDGTPFDFRAPHKIGERIDEPNKQLSVTKGYDHNWVLNTGGDSSRLAAKVSDEVSGRTLEVYTNEPGVQIYTANGLSGKTVGKGGIAYGKRTAICFEAQHFADSPNKPQFPSTELRPGETYRSVCIYRFGVER
jgi:aldose 1-epimerase